MPSKDFAIDSEEKSGEITPSSLLITILLISGEGPMAIANLAWINSKNLFGKANW